MLQISALVCHTPGPHHPCSPCRPPPATCHGRAAYQEALAFNPKIVVINLGYNDFDDNTEEALRAAWGGRDDSKMKL